MSNHFAAVLFLIRMIDMSGCQGQALLFAVLYMAKYICRIAAKETTVLLAVVREFEEQFFIFVGSLEERCSVEVPLGQER